MTSNRLAQRFVREEQSAGGLQDSRTTDQGEESRVPHERGTAAVIAACLAQS
jgi:hypothetical protein